MKRRIIALILIFIMSLNVIVKPQKAEAVVLADDLAAGIIVCLIACGYVVTTNDSMQKSAAAFWESASSGCQSAIQSGVASGQMVLGSFWSEVQNWVQTANLQGYVEYNQLYGEVDWSGTMAVGEYNKNSGYKVVQYAGDFEMIFQVSGNYISQGTNYQVWGSRSNSDSYPYPFDLIACYTGSNTTRLCNKGLGAGMEFVRTGYSQGIKIIRSGSYVHFYDLMSDTLLYSTFWEDMFYKVYMSVTRNAANTQAVTFGITTTGTAVEELVKELDYDYVDVATNPYWDLFNNPPIVPPWVVPNDYVGKTATNLDYTTVNNPPTVDTGAATEVGWLTNIYNLLKTIGTSIARFFDFSKAINLNPLKLVGTTFTNKFPFSLPWDLLHSMQSLVTNQEPPIFHFEIPQTVLLPSWNVDLDFSMWQPIVNVSRIIELLLFDIALIMITRRLLGGDV